VSRVNKVSKVNRVNKVIPVTTEEKVQRGHKGRQV
jgi:hypothetical protein